MKPKGGSKTQLQPVVNASSDIGRSLEPTAALFFYVVITLLESEYVIFSSVSYVASVSFGV